MDAARRGKWIGFLCLGVTAFGWALNWPLMKLLLQWPPLFARGLAGVAAGLILLAIAKARGNRLKSRARRCCGYRSRPSTTFSPGWVLAPWRMLVELRPTPA